MEVNRFGCPVKNAVYPVLDYNPFLRGLYMYVAGPFCEGVKYGRIYQFDDRARIRGNLLYRQDLFALLGFRNQLQHEVLGNLFKDAAGPLPSLYYLSNLALGGNLDFDRPVEQHFKFIEIDNICRICNGYDQGFI